MNLVPAMSSSQSLSGSMIDLLSRSNNASECTIKYSIHIATSLAIIPLILLSLIEGVARFALGLFIWVIAKACIKTPETFYNTFYKEALPNAGKAFCIGIKALFSVGKKRIAASIKVFTEAELTLLKQEAPLLFRAQERSYVSDTTIKLLQRKGRLTLINVVVAAAKDGSSRLVTYGTNFPLALLNFLTAGIEKISLRTIEELESAITHHRNISDAIKKPTCELLSLFKTVLKSLEVIPPEEQKKIFNQIHTLTDGFAHMDLMTCRKMIFYGVRRSRRKAIRPFFYSNNYKDVVKTSLAHWDRTEKALYQKIFDWNKRLFASDAKRGDTYASQQLVEIEQLRSQIEKCGKAFHAIKSLGRIGIESTSTLLGHCIGARDILCS